jgi:hypothetical protein
MAAKGFNIAEEGHIVNALAPVDITGGASTDRWKMTLDKKVTIIIQVGASAAAFTSIIVNSATASTSGTTTAIPFSYYAETTAGGDTLGARTTVAATGITSVSANDGIMYVIDVDASELPDGSPWLYVTFANGSNSVIASVVAILSGSRYGNDQNETRIA